jgi:hypothetical protein
MTTRVGYCYDQSKNSTKSTHGGVQGAQYEEKEKMDNTNRTEPIRSKSPIQPQSSNPGIAGYEIRVKDHLDTYWLDWFEGWSVTNLENGEVLLKSSCVDQSRLHGALNKIRDLNLTLLSVTRISTN